MTPSRVLIRLCILVSTLTLTAMAAAQGSVSGVVSGVVRDGDGKPLAGITLTLTGHSTSRTISGTAGNYRFSGIALGDYTLAAESPGFVPTPPLKITFSASSPSVIADLKLVRASSPGDTAASPPPPLQFESSSIRGLIDPGGYSASTGSAAATSVLRGIADVKREGDPTGTSAATSSSVEWPCSLEPTLRKALAEHPDKSESNRRLGQFYLAHHQTDRAIPLLKRAVETGPTSGPAAHDLALAWLDAQDFSAARELLSSLIAHHDDPELHRLLARADEGSGLFQQAAAEYRQADAEHPSPDDIFGVGYELLLAGAINESGIAFDSGVQRYPKSIPLRLGAGTALFLSGQTGPAIDRLLSAIEIEPNDPRPYPLLAAAGANSASSDRLLNTFQRFLDQQPDNAQANYFYALALYRRPGPADSPRVEQLLKRSIRIDPDLAAAHSLLAEAYFHRGNDADAVAEYQSAIRLADDPQTHYRLALALKRLGRLDESTREMQQFRNSAALQSQPQPQPQDSADLHRVADRIDLAQFISVMKPRGAALESDASPNDCAQPAP